MTRRLTYTAAAELLGIGVPTLPSRCDSGGFVYFVQADTVGLPTKIGMTRNPRQRLGSLQASTPHDVRLLAYFWAEDPAFEEGMLHREFQASRLHGEWFAWGAELEQVVRDISQCTQLHRPYSASLLDMLLLLIDETDEAP